MKVIPKKGGVEDAGNYLPIRSLPVLYKLFATALYARLAPRLAPRLDKCQPPDQGGFRPSHQTVGHLVLYWVLEQRCREWCVQLYISTIDFTKAFDRIQTPGNVDVAGTLWIIHDRQRECSVPDERHEKGDLVSSLLFNTALEYALEDDLKKW